MCTYLFSQMLFWTWLLFRWKIPTPNLSSWQIRVIQCSSRKILRLKGNHPFRILNMKSTYCRRYKNVCDLYISEITYETRTLESISMVVLHSFYYIIEKNLITYVLWYLYSYTTRVKHESCTFIPLFFGGTF